MHKWTLSKNERMIHLYGPPASGKTTLAIQLSRKVFPRSTIYFITSHRNAITKRAKQILNKNYLKEFYLIKVSSLDDLFEKIQSINSLEKTIGLIVIDYISDFVRGKLYKEEVKNKVRKILEKLFIFSSQKDCLVVIVNSFSIKNEAPLNSLVESFCDMSVYLSIKDDKYNLESNGKNIKRTFVVDEKIISSFVIDEKGIKDLIIVSE
ncbi:MAG: AAA family ATPase [Candidatus Heimdallarchaeaceae archaeon]